MDRIGEIRRFYIEKLKNHAKNEASMQAAYAHSYGVSYMGAFIAAKRNENIELATIAGMLHDVAKFIVTDNPDESHAVQGSRIAFEWLQEIRLFSEDEVNIIITAIKNHENKASIDTPFDEVLKDADVMAHGLFNVPMKNFRTYRWMDLLAEFDLHIQS